MADIELASAWRVSDGDQGVEQQYGHDLSSDSDTSPGASLDFRRGANGSVVSPAYRFVG